jgi:hypothetical protein
MVRRNLAAHRRLWWLSVSFFLARSRTGRLARAQEDANGSAAFREAGLTRRKPLAELGL